MDCSFNNNLQQIALNQNPMQIESESIGLLPPELVSKIFSYIHIPSELARWALVCRSWKEWAYEKSFEIREEEEIGDEKQ
jgi:hypothetical protein